MEIYESIFRVSHGGSSLLAYGDPMPTAGVTLDGSQPANPTAILGAAGIRTFPRGGESHTLEFSIIEPEYSTRNALVTAMNHAVNAPRGSADVIISLANGWSWKLENATVESWTSETDGVLSIRTISIIGGRLTRVTSGSLDVPPVINQPDLSHGGPWSDADIWDDVDVWIDVA